MIELIRVPSKGFYKLLDKIADNEKTTRDYFDEALTLARREKFTDLEIALLMKDYLKDKIPKATLWRWTKALEPKEEEEEKETEDSTSGSVSVKPIEEKKEPEQCNKDEIDPLENVEKRTDLPKHGVYEEPPEDSIFNKPKLDDIANHPLYIRSQELNEELRGQLENARQAIQQLQEALKAQGMFTTAKEMPVTGHSSTLKIPGPMFSKMFQIARSYLSSRDSPRFYLEAVCDGDNIVDFREPTR